ncbi:MAG: NUDIX hydrolase [Gammaproteobacteria bacterium]|nr:NUDIX hydrolase [Gammaproteobacteria bacterium]
MNFCSQCGATVTHRVPAGDDRPRHVCDTCGTIFYSNPKIVAGCIPEWQGRVLLCRRAIDPRSGLWTLPAGFMENGETTADAAVRETMEEANAKVEVSELFTYFNIPRINQVHLFFLARMLAGDFAAGAESLEVDLFTEARIPWSELAFPSVEETLRHYFADRRSGCFSLHMADLHRRPG